MFYAFLANFQFNESNHIGDHYLYSNLAYGLLGDVLATAFEKCSFGDMLETLIFAPLEMSETYTCAPSHYDDAKQNRKKKHSFSRREMKRQQLRRRMTTDRFSGPFETTGHYANGTLDVDETSTPSTFLGAWAVRSNARDVVRIRRVAGLGRKI
jgi:CubicO group peptidase (beta-lactamase class C family)